MKSKWLALALALLLIGCVNHEQLGDEAAVTGDYHVAIKHYETAAADDPENAILAKKLENAKVRATDDFYALGKKALDNRDPQRAIELLSSAYGWIQRPEIKVALDEAKALLKVVTAEGLAKKGHASRLAKRLNRAQQQFHKALEHDPSNELAREGLSQVNAEIARLKPMLVTAQHTLTSQDWSKALEQFNEILASWTDNDEAVAGKKVAAQHVAYEEAVAEGRGFESRQDWAGALKAYRKAQGIKGSKEIQTLVSRTEARVKSTAMTDTGRSQLKARALTKAQATLREALRLYPDNAGARELLARVESGTAQATDCFARGDSARTNALWEEAIDLYEEGLAIWADHPQAAARLEVCIVGRDHDREIARGDRAFSTADWALAMKHYKAANGIMKGEIANNRIQRTRDFRRADALTTQATESFEATDLTEAESLIAKALSLNPENAKATSLLAEVRKQQGLVEGLFAKATDAEHKKEWQQAKDLYVAAQRLWGDNRAVAHGLAVCAASEAVSLGDDAASKGDWTKAAAHYATALKTVDTHATRQAFKRASYMHHFSEGEAHENAGDVKAALKAYRAAAKHRETPEVLRRIKTLKGGDE